MKLKHILEEIKMNNKIIQLSWILEFEGKIYEADELTVNLEIGLMSISWTQKVKLFHDALLANNSHWCAVMIKLTFIGYVRIKSLSVNKIRQYP